MTHQIHILGDCYDIFPHIPDNSVDLILTDPPYEISVDDDGMPGGSWGAPGDPGYVKRPQLDFGEWDRAPIDLDSMFKEFYRILKPHGTAIIFYDIWKMESLKASSEKFKFVQHRLGHWQKTNPMPLNSKLNYLTNSREYFCSMVKLSKPTFHSEYDWGIYECGILHGKERYGHPTPKPVPIIKALMEKHSNPGEIVFDPFAGTGTTTVAGILSGRNVISIERDANHYSTSKQRILSTSNNKLFKLSDVDFLSYNESNFSSELDKLLTEIND